MIKGELLINKMTVPWIPGVCFMLYAVNKGVGYLRERPQPYVNAFLATLASVR